MTDILEPHDRRLLRRQMLADDVYEAIKTMLMDHTIRPGGRISIDGLAREFQVSSTPVREALARLESEGLADKEPLKGYRATPLLTLEEFEDLYSFRRLLEPWAARRAAELIDDTGRERLTAELSTAVEPTSVDYAGYKSLTAHDNRFHTLIAELSGATKCVSPSSGRTATCTSSGCTTTATPGPRSSSSTTTWSRPSAPAIPLPPRRR